MNSRYTQFGATTALVALAVVVSLGSVTDVQAGAALAHLRPEARVQVANEGQAVAEFLSRLSEAVRLLQCEPHTPQVVAIAPDRTTVAGLVPLTALGRIAVDDTHLSPPPPAFQLIDMPPPAGLR